MEKTDPKKLQGILNRVFNLFYHNLLNLPHLSSFFPSPHMFKGLVQKQSNLMVNLLLDKENSLKNYESVILLHHKIGLPQEDFIDSMEFIKGQLLNLSEKGKIPASPQKVESLFHELTELSYEIYLTEDLKELRKTWKKFLSYIPEISSDQIKLLEALEQACLIRGEEKSQTAQELIAFLIKNVSCFEANHYFSSADFLLKSYSARDVSLALQKLNEELYNLVCHLTKYIRNRNYKYAYRTWARLSEKSKLLLLYSIFLKYKWEVSKEKSLSEFLLDPLFEEKIFSLIFIPTDIDKLAIRVFKIFSLNLIRLIDESSYGIGTAFIHEDKEKEIYRCYVIYLTEREKKDWVKSSIKKLLKKAENITCQKLSISEEQLGKYIKAVVISGDTLKLSTISREDFPIFIDSIEETVKENFPSKTVVEISDLSETISEFQEVIAAVKVLKNPERKNYLKLYAQPIINLKSEEREGIEVLSRIVLPNGKLISPYKFLKVVKKLKFTAHFDRAVLHKLKQFIENCDEKENCKIFVNLYPTSCYNHEVLEKLNQVKEAALKKGIEIVAEVIETEDVDIGKVIPSLTSHNFHIAIDDFGTGYSNFERIAQLVEYESLKYIKIDGSLVKKAKKDKVFKAIVETITSLANKLGKNVIYEFIEDEELLSTLKKIGKGSALGQGYFLGKPAPIENFL